MKYSFIFYSIICLGILSCNNPEEKDAALVIKNYGWKIENDSFIIDLQPNTFDTFKDFTNRIETIVCEDSIPRITLKNEKSIQHISLSNPCYLKYACILIKGKNVITIHNNIVNKQGHFYPMDSLQYVIRRDIENYGTNPSYADHPDKLLFKITSDANEFQHFSESLQTLINTYEKVTQKTDIKIWVEQPLYLIPPPPPLKND